MLVLTRKTDEEIVIDGDVRISIVEIRGNRVKLGVTAPKSVSVQRQEIIFSEHGLKAPARVSLGSGI
ncbi:MAG: carbon storage regulator [Planctomycetaceae bacterium]